MSQAAEPASATREGPGPDRSVVMVVSAADHLIAADGSRLPTGYWASEVVEPYEVLAGAGYEVTIVTPGGKTPSPDERSLDEDGIQARIDAIPALAEPGPLSAVEDVTAYAAVVLPGGHGPMGDLYGEPELGRVLRQAVADEVPVAAICHGPAGLLAALQGPDAAWPFSGAQMTAFSDAEEETVGLRDVLPWSLEQTLRDVGAKLDLADEPFAVKVVVDGLLVTGQNPASAAPATEALVSLLRSRA
jgi:putative intracellular protease/amidase